MKYSRELCLFSAPNINSYKRYESMSWAPTRQAWSTDNRTTGLRVVGHGAGLRVENRMPGADANPYLAFAAMIAAGLAGVEEELDPGAEYRGNAYIDESLPALPSTLARSRGTLRRQRPRPRGVFSRGGRALRPRRAAGGARLRCRGDRLGAAALLRADLSKFTRPSTRVPRSA